MISTSSYLLSFLSDASIWELRTGTRVTVLQGHCDIVSSVCVYKDRYLLSADYSSLVVVWDIKDKFKRAYECTLHSDAVFHLLIANDCLYSCSRDGSIVVVGACLG